MHKVTPLPRDPGGSGGSLGGRRRRASNVAVQMCTYGPERVRRAGLRGRKVVCELEVDRHCIRTRATSPCL